MIDQIGDLLREKKLYSFPYLSCDIRDSVVKAIGNTDHDEVLIRFRGDNVRITLNDAVQIQHLCKGHGFICPRGIDRQMPISPEVFDSGSEATGQ